VGANTPNKLLSENQKVESSEQENSRLEVDSSNSLMHLRCHNDSSVAIKLVFVLMVSLRSEGGKERRWARYEVGCRVDRTLM